jgi:CelD/BcsL family acetyltransferase involved in cellulose biosynthesis
MATPIINSHASAAVNEQRLIPSSGLYTRKFIKIENHALRVTTCNSWEKLEEWVPSWDAILHESESLSIFSTPEWIGSWWKAFGTNKRMIALAFSTEENALVGLAPLYLDDVQSSPFGKLAHLRLIGDGSGDSDGLDVIARPGCEGSCAQALLHWLTEHQNWDLCSLNTMAGSSAVAKALIHELARAEWTFLSGSYPNSAIHLPGSWSQYVEERLSPGFRPLVTRYPRKLADRYQVSIHRCENADDLTKGLEILFSLHTKRWSLANQPGSFGSQERKEFYEQMSRRFLRRGWLELWVLELNGVAAAAQFCFRYGDTVSILQEGFDPEFAADKVGYALRATMLKHFIETGVKHYDFLGGLADHKQKWGAEPGEYLNLHFARPGSLGSLYLSCTNALTKSKEWLRVNLPEPAWNALRWLKVKLSRQADSSAL